MTSGTTTTEPATSSRLVAGAIADSLRSVLHLGELLSKDIPAEKFDHMPHPNMNHPAFCFGHLSIYPNKVLTMIGRPDLVHEKDGWAEILEASATCVEQIGLYPPKDEIIAHFLERHRTVLDVLHKLDDGQLAGESPTQGKFKEMFPTLASVAIFMMASHAMYHLGQVSAWRRAMGLPSVM